MTSRKGVSYVHGGTPGIDFEAAAAIRPAGLTRRVAVRHDEAGMEAELNTMVDNGCTVVDVIVEHPLYGQLTGPLQLSSRYDVAQFIARSHTAQPLSVLTGGIHLHTLLCPSEDAYRRVLDALRQAGFLLEG